VPCSIQTLSFFEIFLTRKVCRVVEVSQPIRLDLTDIHCQAAKVEGVLVSINSAAHSAQRFDLLRFGIKQARRGWLEKETLNTRSLKELRRLLRATM